MARKKIPDPAPKQGKPQVPQTNFRLEPDVLAALDRIAARYRVRSRTAAVRIAALYLDEELSRFPAHGSEGRKNILPP